jgi:molybdopterin molybdotransferase
MGEAVMRTVDEHVAAAVSLVSPLPATGVAVTDALGLVLASPVVAGIDSPPFANSAMDGFAVCREDVDAAVPGISTRLTISGESVAGSASAPRVEPGRAVRVMTGAPIPTGAAAVIPVEMTDATFGDSDARAAVSGTVTIRDMPQGRTHIRLRGDDVRAGDVVMSPGRVLGPAQMAAAASVGVAVVDVIRRPRVAILATGDELVEPGRVLGGGQIYDSNSVVLAASVTRHGGVPLVLARVGDTERDLIAAVSRAEADLIVTSGGVSEGVYDVVKGALRSRGVEFSRVAMQPGKPQGLGVLDGTPIACLPGNPVSSLVSFEVIVAPMMRVLRGLPAHREPDQATAGASWRTPPGRQQYMPVSMRPDGSVVPATHGGSGSHLVARLAMADALAVAPAEVDEVREGDTVELIRLTA